jgi:hypothetical protein
VALPGGVPGPAATVAVLLLPLLLPLAVGAELPVLLAPVPPLPPALLLLLLARCRMWLSTP